MHSHRGFDGQEGVCSAICSGYLEGLLQSIHSAVSWISSLIAEAGLLIQLVLLADLECAASLWNGAVCAQWRRSLVWRRRGCVTVVLVHKVVHQDSRMAKAAWLCGLCACRPQLMWQTQHYRHAEGPLLWMDWHITKQSLRGTWSDPVQYCTHIHLKAALHMYSCVRTDENDENEGLLKACIVDVRGIL